MSRQLDAAALRDKSEAGLKYASRIDRETLAARLSEIPQDTRPLTARIFGDPLPGRSALDRRAGA